MGEVATKQSGVLTPRNMAEAMQFAEMVAVSSFCPGDFKGKPADILVAVQWASEVGLSPYTAMQNMAVINGKPSLYGDGLLAVITGHKEYVSHKEWREGDEAFCTIVRMRFGEKVETTRSFSLADAKQAGLTNKGPWRAYPKRMLQMRARGFAARDSFPDALSGMVIKEEAEDYPTEPDEPKDITDQVVEVPSHPMDASFGKGEPESDPQISPVSDDVAIPDTSGPENTDVAESATEEISDEEGERAWEMSHEDGIKEFPTADEWKTAMWKVWKDIEADKDMSFEDRRHEIAEHKKDHDDTIDRLKTEYPQKAEAFGKDYKKILRRLSAKAKEAQK
tara:strand:+ start:218 stop:1225 length:1008 start_codon:yes stop_codon:yes gene_type:complete